MTDALVTHDRMLHFVPRFPPALAIPIGLSPPPPRWRAATTPN
jgi:hypothetical protein